MFSYIIPLIRKKPTYIILHIGTNDATFNPADEILIELLQLKTFILKHLPSCNIVLLQPTTRNDNSAARGTIRNLISKINQKYIEF